MPRREVNLNATQFLATCRGLKAASRGTLRQVQMKFQPGELLVEGPMGGGMIQTTGNFSAQATVGYDILAKIANLHRAQATPGSWIKCTLDDEASEIRFPLGGLKAKFNNEL